MPQIARPPTQASEWTERQLLRRVLGRDDRAWMELVRRYRSLIYRCITKVTARCAPSLGSADVDEIYGDVLLNLLRDDMRKLRLYNPRRGTKTARRRESAGGPSVGAEVSPGRRPSRP